MNLQLPAIGVGWVIALVVLLISVVLMVVQGPSIVLGLIAALALARML